MLPAPPRTSKGCYIQRCFLSADCENFVILESSGFGYFLRMAIYILYVYSVA